MQKIALTFDGRYSILHKLVGLTLILSLSGCLGSTSNHSFRSLSSKESMRFAPKAIPLSARRWISLTSMNDCNPITQLKFNSFAEEPLVWMDYSHKRSVSAFALQFGVTDSSNNLSSNKIDADSHNLDIESLGLARSEELLHLRTEYSEKLRFVAENYEMPELNHEMKLMALQTTNSMFPHLSDQKSEKGLIQTAQNEYRTLTDKRTQEESSIHQEYQIAVNDVEQRYQTALAKIQKATPKDEQVSLGKTNIASLNLRKPRKILSKGSNNITVTGHPINELNLLAHSSHQKIEAETHNLSQTYTQEQRKSDNQRRRMQAAIASL